MIRDDRTVAIAIALGICVAVYVVGQLLLVAAGEFLHVSDDILSMLSTVLLFAALMAALVVLLRDKSRRT